MIKRRRGGVRRDRGGRHRLPSLFQSAFSPTAIRVPNSGMKMQHQKKKRQICARPRYVVEVGVRSIEQNGANLKEKQLI